MASKDLLRQIGNLTNDAPMLELAAHPSDSEDYLYMEKLVLCVYEASDPQGICQIKTDTDSILWTISTGKTKEFTLDFGPRGIELGQHSYLRAVVSGSTVEQASVSLAFVGYRSHTPHLTEWRDPNKE